MRQNSGTNLGHDRRLAATRLATEDERSTATRRVPFCCRLSLLMLLMSDVVSDETQDVVATLEFVTAIAAHGQMLNDLDDSRLKQAGAGLGERALGRSADQPLQLVAERVAEMFCQCNKAP